MLSAVIDPFMSLAFPQQCQVCGATVSRHSDGVACEACWSETKVFSGGEMLCNKCGAFFSDNAAAVPVYCHKCDIHAYDGATALGIYEKALSSTILSLKVSPRVPRRLHDVLVTSDRIPDNISVVIPVPLAKQRLLERGFNQAEVIARIIAQCKQTSVDVSSLRRAKHTPIHRMGMDQRARELTVEKAFEVVRPKLVTGRHVLLVDDVLTSGSTASACAKALKRSGASAVYVFTLARAVMH